MTTPSVTAPWERWSPDAPPGDERYYHLDTALNGVAADYLADPVLAALAEGQRYVADSLGDPHPVILFIGEAPGEEEAEAGQPFVGRSGKLLDRILAEVHIDRTQHYTTNLLKHRPTDAAGHNRPPTAEEAAAAQPHLLREIELIDPLFIVTLGNTATRALWPEAPGITACRGKWRMASQVQPHLPTVHPSFALRPGPGEEQLRTDLRELARMLTITRRVLVTASRTWPDAAAITDRLDAELAQRGPYTLVHGACKEGGDDTADQWALTHPGVVRIERHPADWATYKTGAGPIRNREMVAAGADLCLAYVHRDSPGAGGTAELAEKAGIRTEVVRSEIE